MIKTMENATTTVRTRSLFTDVASAALAFEELIAEP
jgi:hypothetical protein